MSDVGDRGDLPTGTVTFLFTDIEGSTPLWDSHPSAMSESLTRHDDIVRKAIDTADGHIFSTGGDGFGAVFARAANAVAAAVGAQRGLRAEPWPDDVGLRVRMGLHTGEAQERDGDYFGPPVNRAARLMGAAHGGQIIVSALTAELVDHDSARVRFVDLGSTLLKGVVEPVHVFGVDAEGAEWIDLPITSTQPTAGNLPRPQTELFTDLADLQRRVAALPHVRLLTLTGSGGVGKTRAAIEIGWLVVDDYVDGVWLVELAPIADPAMVIAAVAATLGVQLQPGMTMLESIVEWFVGRSRLLIVDNCEHVLDEVTELVAAIGAACPTVTIVATSREPLGLGGERVIRIPSMEPDYAIELFCDRARAADSSFEPTPADADAIAAICERLDGIPLAIELAAARITSLSPSELLGRLDDRFRLLRGAGRGGLERHQTLRAAVTWSHQLLSDEQRLLFDRLSVFAGGFDLRAAEAVCSGDGIDEFDVIDLLGELVDKSMVIAERRGQNTRYRMLETLREFGEERLQDRGETAAVRDRHLAHYTAVAAQIEADFMSEHQSAAAAVAGEEWNNVRSAHGWAIASEDFDRALTLLWGTGGYALFRLRHEAAEWTSRTLDLGRGVGREEGGLFVYAAAWAFFQGDLAGTQAMVARTAEFALDEASAAIAFEMRLSVLVAEDRWDAVAVAADELRAAVAEWTDPVARYQGLHALVHIDYQPVVGQALLAEARTIGASNAIAEGLRLLGSCLLLGARPPDIDGAIAASTESIELSDLDANVVTGCWARVGLAFAYVFGGRDEARGAARAALAAANEVRYALAETTCIDLGAMYLAQQHSLDAAAILLGYLEVQPAWFTPTAGLRQVVTTAVAEMANLDQLKARGASMSANQAAGFCLDHLADD